MPSIKLRDISKNICQNVNLEIADKELMVLLGPNGAGKTTLLNIIAGLTDYQGSVLFDDAPMDKVEASSRGIGYLFQDLVLFPHLDVTSNIAYSLKVRNKPFNEIEARVEELLDMMKISHLASRYPAYLSGGEKQRIALARALSSSPTILLLDEPLSSLDRQASKYLRNELKQLQKKLGITTVYVTHDLQEAEEMADRIAVIEYGQIEQVATTEGVFFTPINKKVSDFIGAPNILHCQSSRSLGDGITEVICNDMRIVLPHVGNAIRKIAIFPRDIYVSQTRPMGPKVNRLSGIVTAITHSYDAVRIGLKVGETKLVAEMPHHIFEDTDLTLGEKVYIILKLRRIRAYEDNNIN